MGKTRRSLAGDKDTREDVVRDPSASATRLTADGEATTSRTTRSVLQGERSSSS